MPFPQTGDSLGLDTGTREYRTETDSFARIRAYGSASGVPANGPAYFKVWTKSGQIVEYGNARDTTANAAATPTGKTVVTAWLVSRIGDPRGNYVDFRYEQRDLAWGSTPVGGTATPGHEVTLQEIRYTGTSGQAPNNKIAFVYDERPATAPTGQAHDRSEAYMLGSKSLSVKRLAKIQTYINVTATPVKVKTYKLAYSQGPASNRSRLDQVSECAGPAEQPCLPPTRMEYAAGPSQAYQASAAFRASELAGRVMHSIPPPTNYAGATPPVKYGVIAADFNGDGKTDILRWSENPAENELYFSNGDGSFRRITAFDLTDQIFYRHDGCFGSRVVDINGDGLPDILRYHDTSGTWPGGVPHTCPAGSTEIYLSNGDGSFTRKPVNGVTLINRYSILTHGDPLPGEPSGDLIGWTVGRTYYLLDINGDGKVDVVTAHLPAQGNVVPPEPSDPCPVTCTRVFLGDGLGNFSESATNVAMKSLYSPPQGAYEPGQPSHVEDVDGDGLPDIIDAGSFGQEVENDRPRAWRSRGDGNFDEGEYGGKSVIGFPIDWNGDGRSDRIAPGSAAGSLLYAGDGLNKQGLIVSYFPSGLAEGFVASTQYKYTASIQVADFDMDGRQDVLRWHEDPSKNALFLSNGDGTFRESTSFNLKGADQVLKNSAGTNEFILGDFTGRGRIEILRLAATPAAGGSQTNQLYLPIDTTAPPDQLVAMVSPQGLRTDLTWVPLGNSASGSLGERYASDRADTAHAASYPLADTLVPTWLVATTTTDSGVGGQRISTEYSYRGQKASRDGRGGVGLREMRRQQTGADGSTLLTTVTQQLQTHPYIGALAQSETWLGALNQVNPTVLSRSRQIHCDKTATAGAEAAAGVATPCPTTAKVQRPYVYKSIEEGQDLAGNALPTVTTTTSVNDSGDPTQVVSSTAGSVGGVSQTFTKTITHLYHPDVTGEEQWILGRVRQTTVQSSVPNSLANLASSVGSAANATATSGSGPVQVAVLTPALAFGNVVVGGSSTLGVTLVNNGAAALVIPMPDAGAVSGTDFSLAGTTCRSALAAGGTCSINLKFTPSAKTSRSGSLSLATGAGTLGTSLSGTGLQGTASLSATGLVFAATQVGSTSAAQSLTLTNNGTAALSVSAATASSSDYAASHNCGNVALGGTCSVSVSFTPGGAGNRSATLTLTGNASNSPTAISLGGTGQAQSATLGTLNFGGVAVGASSTLSATLANTGIGPLSLAAPGAGAVSGTDFSFISSTCASTLAAGASCTVSVRFSPSAAASRSGSLGISTGAGQVSAALSGIGNGSVATLTSAATLAVPGTWYGSAAQSVTATYRNDGTTTLSLATPALAAPLSVSSNTCTSIAVGASCSMVISVATNMPGLNQTQSFAPSGATNTPASTTVSWSTYTAVPRWSSTSVAFGNVTVGSSATQSLTLTNDGNSAYNWASNNGMANAPSGFSVNTSACTSVAPGGNCSVSVAFTPPAAGSYAGSGLTLASASYSTNSFAVSGTGLTPPSIAASTGTLSASTVAPTAASGSVSFSNSGQTPTALTLAVSGGSSLSASTLNCPANGSCGSVTVSTPTAAGNYNGSLTVSSSAGGSVPSVAVNLAVLAPPALGISPASLTISVAKGLSKSSSVTLTNSGGVAATGLAYTLPGGSSAVGSFSGAPGTCPAAGGSLAAGASCTYSVTYNADCTAGSRSGTFTVSGANFSAAAISLTGTTLSGSCN